MQIMEDELVFREPGEDVETGGATNSCFSTRDWESNSRLGLEVIVTLIVAQGNSNCQVRSAKKVMVQFCQH